ncbi:dual specificity protein phosphatase 26 isoform X1%2C partial [Xyrichtys novacula]|uniref:Dual specificity protein phosphatase 26 isoform X1, partial n=1 Tax=Xyrichtys novacula TaxID=13765 RepID=A0AAV1FVA8_XYRNO|nr:dual specificity protein phosphatase 26 isoform X1%2C partial [Xyrichtys novacula]
MSRKRFHQILRAMRFDDKMQRRARFKNDKLAPIRSLWDMWRHRLPLLFNPGSEVTIDEQLLPFKGRCSFKQYMPKKPAKYGIKIWTAADVSTSYAWKVSIYTGKSGEARELPPQLLNLKGRDVLSSVFAFTNNTTAVSYMPKKGKNVLLISTKHRQPAVEEGPKKKPKMITDYNRCKGAVYTLDQLVHNFSCQRRSRRWPLTLFFNMLDISAFNAYVIYTHVDPSWNEGKQARRRLFLHDLASVLTAPEIMRRQTVPRTPQSLALVKEMQATAHGSAAFQAAHREEELPRNLPEVKRKTCKRCTNRTIGTCVSCGHPICKQHRAPISCQSCNQK